MRVESEPTGRRGPKRQTRVLHVRAVRDPSTVRGNAVPPPTVTTRSRDSAACPVTVSVSNTWLQRDFQNKAPVTEDNTHTSLFLFNLNNMSASNLQLAGCTFHGKEYPEGTEFPDDQDPCSVCYCYGGEVVCNKLPCYGGCSHPYKPPGQCCAECERT